jgi:hypothetical protein
LWLLDGLINGFGAVKDAGLNKDSAQTAPGEGSESGVGAEDQPGGRSVMPRVRPADKQQKERSELKQRLKEISGQIRTRSIELQQELSPENYKRVEDLIRLIESYDGVVVQLLKLPMGLSGGRSARPA